MTCGKIAPGRLLKTWQAWKKKFGLEHGATLIEIVLATAIFSLLLTTLLTFNYGNLQGYKRSLAAVDVQQNARIAMDKTTRILRYACTLKDVQALPLYCPGDELQQGAASLTLTGFTKKNEEKVITAYTLKFNKTKKALELRSGTGPYNEIAYCIAGLDFFRYLPPEDAQVGDNQDLPPMVLVILRIQEKDPDPARGVSCVLQSVVRLQNLVLPIE